MKKRLGTEKPMSNTEKKLEIIEAILEKAKVLEPHSAIESFVETVGKIKQQLKEATEQSVEPELEALHRNVTALMLAFCHSMLQSGEFKDDAGRIDAVYRMTRNLGKRTRKDMDIENATKEMIVIGEKEDAIRGSASPVRLGLDIFGLMKFLKIRIEDIHKHI